VVDRDESFRRKTSRSVILAGMFTRRSMIELVGLAALMLGCQTASPDHDVEPLSIWSSSGPESDTPVRAANATVRALIGVTPVLGEFMAGDSRSGEMIVFSPGETVAVERSLLLLRQLGPDDRWSVIGAINPAMTIDVPASGDIVPSGPITVTGRARGFEALVVVSAHRVGDTVELIDQQITTAGSLEESEPFRVELDLSDANYGEVITIVVRGGVGLEDDPGEFSAIPIRIAG
jgi:hypothetical protein